jgi:antibiotic biosynthesis monooxygenase (ABM) superfamily enzyme
MQGSDHWFVYSRTAGRITAAPANWKGWLVLVLGIGLTAASGFAVMRLNEGLHPLLRVLMLSAVILAGVLLLVRLAMAKGRPAGPS